MSVRLPESVAHLYILSGHEPVPEPDVLKWAKWFEIADRIVARTELPPTYMVSTVFLGVNHGLGGNPVLFETMVFSDRSGEYTERYSTWQEAEAGHSAIVARLTSGA
jgi:hypothetical protein